MSWSVASGCRVLIANWRSWPFRGARSTSPCSLRWRVVVRVVARRRLPLARRDSIFARMVSALGGGWGRSLRALMWGTSAIAGRMISVAKSGAAVIDFNSSMNLGRFVDRQAREDVERSNVEVGDGADTVHCETQYTKQYGSGWCDPRVEDGVEAVGEVG